MKKNKALQPFPHDLLFHFSYHKCLTVYYVRILKKLGSEFGFKYIHNNGELDTFLSKVKKSQGKSIISINNNSNIPFAKFGSYRASHFIRDPRDLVVSGYRYHLWTHEEWCNDPNFNWPGMVKTEYFKKYITSKESEFPHDITYKDYLTSLSSLSQFFK